MNRMKQFWDEKHPELNSFTLKNLRDHVSSIIKRKVVMETDFDLQNQNIEQTNTDNSDTTINDNTFVNHITGSDNSSIIIEQITPEISNIKESIREQFKINFETALANFKDQQINTKLNKNFGKTSLQLITLQKRFSNPLKVLILIILILINCIVNYHIV